MPNFNGTSGADIFTGGPDNDTAAGNGGNDQLSGGGGQDRIGGGAGADVVSGDDGSDEIYSFDISPPFTRPYYGNPWTPPVMDIGAEFDTLSGGAGSDLLFAGYGDQVDGGADFDTLYISFLGAPTGVTADFRQLQNNGSITIGGGIISGIEAVGWIEGSNFDDVITDSDASSNFTPMFGRGGNDRLYGGYYTGDIHGGDGDDLIDRGSSPYGFQHYGEAGNDLLIGSYNGERLDGGEGNDELRGHGGFDDLHGGDGDDLMDAGSYDDTMSGGAGNDIMYGAGDPDVMDGGSGNDELHGDFSPIATGNALSPSRNEDRLFGGTGADVLYGNQGNDTLWSGERDGEFGIQGKDDVGLERDQLFGGDGNDALAIGYGDDADGGDGSDTLRISLAGAQAGVIFSTSGFSPGGLWSVNGGTVQNIETLTIITGSAFGDQISIATHAFGLNIEAGDGNDIVSWGNSSVSVNGGNGNDRFIDSIPGDFLDGGVGTDTVDYRNATAGVTVNLALIAGQTGSGPGGDQLKNIENIDGSSHDDALSGSNDANLLQGMAGADTLYGRGGNDVLIGGPGVDRAYGGTGDDIYGVDDSRDEAIEDASAGYDRVYTDVDYRLGANVEYLQAGNLGGTAPLTLIGNAQNNWIYGNAGNNVIAGEGGADSMAGLGGDDLYYVDSPADVIYEAAGGGYDRVSTSSSYTLDGNVEYLQAGNLAGTEALSLVGNALNNWIYGNAGNNVISGGGGADAMIGLGGDDLYYVDSPGDVIYENTGGGYDRVSTSASYTLDANLEFLQVSNIAGTEALTLVGNALDNWIYGNNGNNVISGEGGSDSLAGFGGDDLYYVDSSDAIYEDAGGGYDRVSTNSSFALGANLEFLQVADLSSTAPFTLTGNDLDNWIYGNAGANLIDGRGGHDVLIGGGGADVFAFTTAPSAANVDTIADFAPGTDSIRLAASVFAGLAPGALAASAFVQGAAATTADHRIIYNPQTGQLLFDADGNGAGAAVQFALLSGGLTQLSAADFAVV